jgi:hypothetical protein
MKYWVRKRKELKSGAALNSFSGYFIIPVHPQLALEMRLFKIIDFNKESIPIELNLFYFII